MSVLLLKLLLMQQDILWIINFYLRLAVWVGQDNQLFLPVLSMTRRESSLSKKYTVVRRWKKKIQLIRFLVIVS